MMSIFDVKNRFLAHRPKINLEASAHQKTKILAQNRWFLNKKWLVEHHTCMLDRVIRGQGGASFRRQLDGPIYYFFLKFRFLPTFPKYNFDINIFSGALKHGGFSRANRFDRLSLYQVEKLGLKSTLWCQFLTPKSIFGASAQDQPRSIRLSKNHDFIENSMIFK